jgi:lipopolysaccharide export system protein LptA
MKKMKYFAIALLLLPFLLTGFGSVSAQTDIKDKDKGPIHITSDSMTANNKDKIITFTGNVVTKRGGSTIYSDALKIYYQDNKNDEKKGVKKEPKSKTSQETEGFSSNVTKILAIGNVKIEQGERYATGERAEYFENEKKIVLTGNPVAWEKGNKILGTEMIFFIDRDETIIKGSKERRVNVTIFPEDKDKPGQKKP